MKHRMICKYDRSSNEYLNEWTTLSEVVSDSDETIPSDYLAIESDFLDAAAHVLSLFPSARFEYKYIYAYEDEFPDQLDPTVPRLTYEGLTLPIPEAKRVIETSDFNALSKVEQRFLFQLCTRVLIGFCIQDRETGVTLSSMDDGFYWYVAVPDHIADSSLLKSDRLFLYETIDNFE
jgi:hypothetical protein